ncbi:hypothetical protein AB0F72_30625 [Actinoplanes sp. NPDC023936]|uniref:hypothetical protein n=1 Tax=Actinoplanes sp. NPDC023936 TaxID=3154910 RepID=UPI0033C995A8
MGRLIAAYRTHPEHDHPISQAVVGQWAFKSQSQVCRIEKGRGETDIRALQSWAGLLGIPAAILWFAMPEDHPEPAGGQAEESPPGDMSCTTRMTPSDRFAYGDERVALGGTVTSDHYVRAEREGLTVVSPLDGDGGVFRRDYLKAAAIGAGVALGIPLGPGRKIGAGIPDLLRERAARLRRVDNFLGGGDTFDIYFAEYQATKAVLREYTYSEATGRRLLAVLAEQAQQAGWAAFDAGDHEKAAALYEISRSAAEEAQDTMLAGNALAFLGYLRSGDDPQAAVRLATASCAVAGDAAVGSVGALLHERRAWANAVVGNAAEAARALDAAHECLDKRGHAAGPDWAAWVDAGELQIMAGRCWTELRRPLRAVPALTEVLEGFDEAYARDKALYMCWLADAYLIAGEAEESARVASRALTLSAGVASVRPRKQLSRVLNRLAGHSHLAEVAQVLENARH